VTKSPAHPHHLLVLLKRSNDSISIRLHPLQDQFRQEDETAAQKQSSSG
jgi:hypothetical protein